MSKKVLDVIAALEGKGKLVQRRTACSVGHAIDPGANGGTSWAYWHRWTDSPDQCIDCRQTRKETLEWVPPRSS